MHSYATLIHEQIARNDNYKRIISAHPHQRRSSPGHIVLTTDPINKTYSLQIAFDIHHLTNVVGGVYVSKPFYALQHLFNLFRSTYDCVTPYIFKGEPLEMLTLMQSCTEQYGY